MLTCLRRSPSPSPEASDRCAAQTTAADLFAEDRAVVVARVNGELRDLAHELGDGDAVEPVPIDSADGLNILRHSTAHVLAQAVQEVFPEARLGIGPPIENGFYYDFDVERRRSPPRTSRSSRRMRKIIKEGQTLLPPRDLRRRRAAPSWPTSPTSSS